MTETVLQKKGRGGIIFFFKRHLHTQFFLVQGSSFSLQNNGQQEQQRWEWGVETE